jgi:hypothetical protein
MVGPLPPVVVVWVVAMAGLPAFALTKLTAGLSLP